MINQSAVTEIRLPVVDVLPGAAQICQLRVNDCFSALHSKMNTNTTSYYYKMDTGISSNTFNFIFVELSQSK